MPRYSLRDKTMTSRKIENGLAYVGALVVLTAVLAAASSAFAAEPKDTEKLDVSTQSVAVETVNDARKAMRETADAAAKALRIENSFDLENQLSAISSPLMASNN